MIASKNRVKDKSDRATVEQVLDPRTRLILFKLLNKGYFSEINGCISTGKEANVYHAVSSDGSERAIKIYKTSILTFKDRDKYVSGEFRFRHGYCKHNPRKMVRTWAEKEMRNLTRIHRSGLSCPEPFLLKSVVLIMSFIGESGLGAPLLKDVELKESKANELYFDCVEMVYKLYRECKLVHADLSEFNILYHKGTLWLIDVSQSVEWDHPSALEFLRKDCANVNSFFRKKGVSTLTTRELFEYTTSPNITADCKGRHFQKLQEIAKKRSFQELTDQEKVDDEVFKESFIPKRLDEVIDCEKEIFYPEKKKEEQLFQLVSGIKNNSDYHQSYRENDSLSSSSSSISSSNESCDSEMDDEIETDGVDGEKVVSSKKRPSSSRPRDESPESKKVSI